MPYGVGAQAQARSRYSAAGNKAQSERQKSAHRDVNAGRRGGGGHHGKENQGSKRRVSTPVAAAQQPLGGAGGSPTHRAGAGGRGGGGMLMQRLAMLGGGAPAPVAPVSEPTPQPMLRGRTQLPFGQQTQPQQMPQAQPIQGEFGNALAISEPTGPIKQGTNLATNPLQRPTSQTGLEVGTQAGTLGIDPEMVTIASNVVDGINSIPYEDIVNVPFNELESGIAPDGTVVQGTLGEGVGFIVNTLTNEEFDVVEATYNAAGSPDERWNIINLVVSDYLPMAELAQAGLIEELPSGNVDWQAPPTVGEGGDNHTWNYPRGPGMDRGNFPLPETPGVSAPSLDLGAALESLTRARGGRILEIPASLRRLLQQFGMGDQFAQLLAMLGFQALGDISMGGVMTDFIVPTAIDPGVVQQALGSLDPALSATLGTVLDVVLGIPSGGAEPQASGEQGPPAEVPPPGEPTPVPAVPET